MYEFTAGGPVAARIKLHGGSCSLTAGEGARVTVRVEPETPGREADRKAASRAAVAFEGGRLTVRVPKGGGAGRFVGLPGGRVRVAVEAPAGSALDFAADSADLAVHGALGALKVDTGSGDFVADRVTGDVSVDTSSGTLRLGHAEGTVDFGSGSGDLQVTHAVGAVRFHSSSGDLVLGTTEGDVRVDTASGDLRIAGARGGSVHARTSSGRIEVGVEEGVGVRRRSTSGGRYRGDLTEDTPAAPGARELHLDLKTSAGDIAVHRTTTTRA
ncbi:DUF4097 family beta strand repeat-containing protein [Streptomyces sp. NPDC049687]|uniref:DUF4097 family beta strand repeat-containing protein n=1 Tax=Streptomyces sp. NPDC049687 TaxID=3365596 RepID=UPI00378C47F2